MRIEHLKQHLLSLQAVNEHNEYAEDIRNTVNEINNELGIGEDIEKQVSTYSTDELIEELSKRKTVFRAETKKDEELICTFVRGYSDDTQSYSGPVQLLIVKDE